jgi:hypothetical protein
MIVFIICSVFWLIIGWWSGYFFHRYIELDYDFNMMSLYSVGGLLSLILVICCIIDNYIIEIPIKIKFSKRRK